MRDWNDVLPPDVALAQHRWERKVTAAKMRRSGMKLHQIGLRLGVCAETARRLSASGEWSLKYPTVRRAPIERYFEGDDVWNEPRPNSLRKGLRQVTRLLSEMADRA